MTRRHSCGSRSKPNLPVAATPDSSVPAPLAAGPVHAGSALQPVLVDAERISEAGSSGTGAQRLLLARVRRPAGDMDDLEGGRQPAVRGGEHLAVEGIGAGDGRPAQR